MRLKFYRADTKQAKIIVLGLEGREPISVIISKLFIVYGRLLKYIFAPLFGALSQTVIDIFSPSFGSSILSINDDICDIMIGIKWIYICKRIYLILKGLFSVYFIMVCGFVDGAFTTNTPAQAPAPAIGAFTKDHGCPRGRVVAEITTIIGGYFWDTLSTTTATIMVLILKNQVSCQRGARIIK